jgi:peptide/nickel transport system substrate-binding protein
MKFKFRKWIILGVLLTFMLLGACTNNTDESVDTDSDPAIESGGELVVASVREPDTVDVHNTTWVDDGNTHLYDTLFRFDEDGNLVNSLVEDYTVSDDSKSVTFTLEEGRTFHSGDPVTAESVVSSLERALEISPVASNLGPINEMVVIDDLNFEIQWDEPFAPFFPNSTTAYLGVLDTTVLNDDNMGFEDNPIATGPLKISEINRGESIIYEPFENYSWGEEGEPDLDKVTFRFIPDDDTRILEFKQGSVNVLTDVPPQYVEELEQEEGVTLERVLGNGNTYLGFNMQLPIFEDVRVRQAISMGIDRTPIVEQALQGLAQPTFGPLPPTILGYSENVENMAEEMYKRDVEEARSLLFEAGWDETNDDGIVMKDGQPFSVELWLTDEPVMQRIGQIVQNQLQEIGVDIQLLVQEDAAIRSQTPEGAHEMVLWQYGWYDADILYSLFGEGQSTRMHYEPTELNEMLEQGRAEMDMDTRLQIYEDAQTFLVEEAPWVPLFVREGVTAHRNVENFSKHPIQDVIQWPGVKLGN